jgi:hypothetical protein
MPGNGDHAAVSDHKSNVGAGLLAKAVFQSKMLWLIHRYREQARFQRGSVDAG